MLFESDGERALAEHRAGTLRHEDGGDGAHRRYRLPQEVDGVTDEIAMF